MSKKRKRRMRRPNITKDAVAVPAEVKEIFEDVDCEAATRFMGDRAMGAVSMNIADARIPVAIFEPRKMMRITYADGTMVDAQVEGIIQSGFTRWRKIVKFEHVPGWTLRQTLGGLELVEGLDGMWARGVVKPTARWLHDAAEIGYVLAIYGPLAGVRRPQDATTWDDEEQGADLHKGRMAGMVAAALVKFQPLPIPETVSYEGPTYNPSTGRIAPGVGAGGRLITWKLHTPGQGMSHGLVVGERGIGKSNFLRVLMAEAVQAQRFVVFLAEPDGRTDVSAALGSLAQQTASTPEASVEILHMANRIIDDRQAEGGYGEPTTASPGVLVLIDEAQQVFAGNPKATKLAERIVAAGGPVSVGLVATVRGADLAYFGGSRNLRTGLAKSQRFALGPDGLDMLDQIREQD